MRFHTLVNHRHFASFSAAESHSGEFVSIKYGNCIARARPSGIHLHTENLDTQMRWRTLKSKNGAQTNN